MLLIRDVGFYHHVSRTAMPYIRCWDRTHEHLLNPNVRRGYEQVTQTTGTFGDRRCREQATSGFRGRITLTGPREVVRQAHYSFSRGSDSRSRDPRTFIEASDNVFQDAAD